jgi:long-chain alkane monooxygenase
VSGPMHFGWFLGDGFGIHPWNNLAPGGGFNGRNGADWMRPDLYLDLTTSLERACFDFVLIEDSMMVEDTYEGSMRYTLKHGRMAPKNDPLPLVPLMTSVTKHIGIIPTVSTIAYHPYLAARLITTLDHLTEGRVGVNVVTSVTDRVAQNFGHDQHFDHDLRYEMAGEWMEAVKALWDSWDPDAVVLDEAGGTYADHTKVHTVDFQGKWFRTRGPLNTIPGPQRHPVVAQAGNSPPGRHLASGIADTMLAHATSVEDMKAFRADMRKRLAEQGRDPDSCKILWLVTPLIAETDAGAQAQWREWLAAAGSEERLQSRLWGMSYISGGRVDFSKFDLDEPVPAVVGNGERSSMATFTDRGEGRTLRELLVDFVPFGGHLGLVGSPDTVAARMGEVMTEVGGDGFLLYSDMTRRGISAVADGLAPALRRRGLIRDGYDHTTFKDNLLAF